MIKKALNTILAILAIIVGLYPLIYFFIDRKFGLLQSKTEAILGSTAWNIGFYTHITLGGIALLLGWTQFKAQWRIKWLTLHRRLGKLYVIAALLSALASIYIAFYATGGLLASLGFTCLGVIWFYFTLGAYLKIRRGHIEAHQEMMIYSYAACLSAVTLRLYLPLLTLLFQDFVKGYLVVAWLCWVPNMIVAWFLVQKMNVENERRVILEPNE